MDSKLKLEITKTQVFRHSFGIGILVGLQFQPCHNIVCAQPHGVGRFLAVSLLRLFLPFPALALSLDDGNERNVFQILSAGDSQAVTAIRSIVRCTNIFGKRAKNLSVWISIFDPCGDLNERGHMHPLRCCWMYLHPSVCKHWSSPALSLPHLSLLRIFSG